MESLGVIKVGDVITAIDGYDARDDMVRGPLYVGTPYIGMPLYGRHYMDAIYRDGQHIGTPLYGTANI